ncbi:MAG: rRNA synthase [Actinomycetota bacterium]|nr:rRNA synthase [Actinomycetota bacterium]
MNETVPAALAGERIDRVVAMLTGLTRAQVADLVDDGAVRIGDRVVVKPSTRVDEGDVVDITLPAVLEAPALEPEGEIDVPIVFADDDVIVVDKPADLVVHPGAGNDRGTMAAGLLARYPEIVDVGDAERPGIVHRLDKGTSGLLVVARTQRAYESLVAQLGARTVDRRYTALVWGHPDPPTGLVDAPIGRSRKDPTRMTITAEGREARTGYELRHRYTQPVEVALLECKLETGRTHQIRVHLAAIGHPIVGDPRYRGARTKFPMTRPFLHAQRLAFDHPVTGERVSFDAPLPPDLDATLARLS